MSNKIGFNIWTAPWAYKRLHRGMTVKSNGINMEVYGKKGTKVLMKMQCGPVVEHQDGLKKTTVTQGKESVVVDMCNKQITMNANYSNSHEDNSFSICTPSAKMEFSLTNPSADIFRPGKMYKITIEEWPEDRE